MVQHLGLYAPNLEAQAQLFSRAYSQQCKTLQPIECRLRKKEEKERNNRKVKNEKKKTEPKTYQKQQQIKKVTTTQQTHTHKIGKKQTKQ